MDDEIKYSVVMVEADEPDNEEFLTIKMNYDNKYDYILGIHEEGLWLIVTSYITNKGNITRQFAHVVGIDGV